MWGWWLLALLMIAFAGWAEWATHTTPKVGRGTRKD